MLSGGDVPKNPWKQDPKFWKRSVEKHTHNSGIPNIFYKQNALGTTKICQVPRPGFGKFRPVKKLLAPFFC